MANQQIEEFRNHIGGEWSAAVDGKTFDNVNPADTRDIVGRFQASTSADAQAAVDAAARPSPVWRGTPISKRAKVLLDAADHIEANAAAFALELTREEGKPLVAGEGRVPASAQTLRFYAIEGAVVRGETFPKDDPDMLVYTQREPLGVVTVISPWNFPVSIPARKIAPALVTGNTVVFKPSSDAPLSGVPAGRGADPLRPAQGRAELHHRRRGAVGAAITESPHVRAISFTGSTAAGKHIANRITYFTVASRFLRSVPPGRPMGSRHRFPRTGRRRFRQRQEKVSGIPPGGGSAWNCPTVRTAS